MAKKQTGETGSVILSRLKPGDVFEPLDWHQQFILLDKASGTARRVRKYKGNWEPFDNRPLRAEQSFFPAEEPVRVIGHHRIVASGKR